jgi:hypothetical protein
MLRTLACASAALIASVASAPAQSRCTSAIAAFRSVIDGDVKAGQLDRSVYERIVPELNQMTQTCRGGRDDEAMRALATVKARFGYH